IPRVAGSDQTEEILAVDEALERLATLEPRQARVVELRYFAGQSVEETAELMGISARTVKADWAMAKGWMRTQLAAREKSCRQTAWRITGRSLARRWTLRNRSDPRWSIQPATAMWICERKWNGCWWRAKPLSGSLPLGCFLLFQNSPPVTR